MTLIIFLQADTIVAGTSPALVPSPTNHLCKPGSSRALVLAKDGTWYVIIGRVGPFACSVKAVVAPHHSTEAAMPQSKAAVMATTLHLQALYYIEVLLQTSPAKVETMPMLPATAYLIGSGGHSVRSFKNVRVAPKKRDAPHLKPQKTHLFPMCILFLTNL